MKIQFHEKTLVIQRRSVGFTGSISHQLNIVNPIPFDIISIERNKKTQCSTIHIWSDGNLDGANVYLINVPNGMYKQISDEDGV